MEGLLKFRVLVDDKNPSTVVMDLGLESRAVFANGATVEILSLDSAQPEKAEQSENVGQQPHGAEPSEICPECVGTGISGYGEDEIEGGCKKCGGSGKLHHA